MISHEYISLLPKAELHLHLEGSANGKILHSLSRKYGTAYRELESHEIEAKLFSFETFEGFLDSFRTVCTHLREPADYLLLLDSLADYLRSQRIRYAEIIVSPAIAWRAGYDGDAVIESLIRRAAEIRAEGGATIAWILDCVRQFGPESARRTAELGLRYRDEGVVGIGLGGDEKSLEMKEFEACFLWAKANGLHVHVHAGEIGGVDQVWEAINRLGANRIGHGIQAARDPNLIHRLRERAIALDICLTSNLKTRAWAPLLGHPFQLLYRRGVPVTLNTDDPGIFRTTLCEEYGKAAKHFSLEREDLHHIVLQSVHSAFLPTEEKHRMMQSFQDEIHRLAV